ncbi:PAS domain-containing sensor histidine kinase [Aureisphaera sp. CAU 1614]|uniref:histidine kinase n=1 Tax=Halomarinibacterium sedimenti TaxID=2857106 RepID=A0A9X1FPX0_9FLAO|nr:PAS domain-containing sensor histidine kinase [Halomarinibacterium sedimenti]MBW2938287.1 PAS domain-containing sensor histidine kinase [Halomarinibacterium sedimenti]
MDFYGKEKGLFDLLTETISEGIVIVNAKQTIVTLNETLAQLFGYNKEELVGEPLEILIPQRYHHNHSSHVKTFLKNSEKRIMGQGRELFGIRKDGSQFPLEVGLKPFQSNGEINVMALVIDITLRKQHEQQLKDLNNQLEQKVSERTQELQDSIVQLENEIEKRKDAENKIKESLRKERELNELKTKFLSLVSHEFKTPLSGILSSTSLIGKYTTTEQQEKREKHVKTITSKVKYLNNILDDFLSVERLETGKVNYKITLFPLSKVINEVIYNANMLLKEGQIINYPEGIDDIEINFDEKVLELVLSNLVNNAIKYSPENTNIDLKVFQKEKSLQITIIDQGIGIPKKEQKFIFNRYFRAENALLNQGTGIGLNIAKSHLENLGGGITFESKENEGSSFKIEIPMAK